MDYTKCLQEEVFPRLDMTTIFSTMYTRQFSQKSFLRFLYMGLWQVQHENELKA